MSRKWEVHEWTDLEKEAFLVEVAAVKARHRATGCMVFDEQFARCTCPKSDD